MVVGCSVTHTIDNGRWGWLLFCGVPSARWFWDGALYPALRCACTGLPGFRAFGTRRRAGSLRLYGGRCGYEEVAVRVAVMCCAKLVCGTPIARGVYGAGSSCTTCVCGVPSARWFWGGALYPALRYACTGLPGFRAFGTRRRAGSLRLYEGRCGYEEVAVAWGHVLRCVGLWSNERLCLRHDGKNVAATKLHLAC